MEWVLLNFQLKKNIASKNVFWMYFDLFQQKKKNLDPNFMALNDRYLLKIAIAEWWLIPTFKCSWHSQNLADQNQIWCIFTFSI